MQTRINRIILIIILLLPAYSVLISQKHDDIKIKIQEFKSDPRGPYKDIRWFCPDGSVVPPQERCPDKGGVQRARYKDYIIELQNSEHLFLGQILSTTSFIDFWDADHNNSRLKQYQIEKYLRSIDNGWINRKAQFYRGAYQAEDEDTWGILFFQNILADQSIINQQFFLIRQAAKDIPHRTDDNLSQNIRLLSKEISDSIPEFLNIRVKIHGQPDNNDLNLVKNFISSRKNKLNQSMTQKLDLLIKNLNILYKQDQFESIKIYLSKLKSQKLNEKGKTFDLANINNLSINEKIKLISEILVWTRKEIQNSNAANDKLILIDISIKLEEIIRVESSQLNAKTLNDAIQNVRILMNTIYGCGYLEEWEWAYLAENDNITLNDSISIKEVSQFYKNALASIEWSSNQFLANYDEIVNKFIDFEPLTHGFIDEKIRNSCLLILGQQLEPINQILSVKQNKTNSIFNLNTESNARGLNTGYAKGKLVIIDNNNELKEVNSKNIYIFNRPPADLKPVAGIMTVTEGNMVSHVQLLARNLGIPNAILAPQLMNDLKQFNGSDIFYAVKKDGSIIMKPAIEMTEEENNLFKKANTRGKEDKLLVPVDKMNLSETSVLNLKNLNATHSGVYCGPKAANLAQLKHIFPENVVEGIVIPFGIFKMHMDQIIPKRNISYWQYLNNIFQHAAELKNNEVSESEIENYVLRELDQFRDLIKNMTFIPTFETDLKNMFQNTFNKELGQVPVFLRSDTNMEDLKEFTGAGLNLTLFNILDSKSIMEGILQVWASPYTERSYKWRQKFLLNPENVFPSILIIPSVNADCSGVVITKNILNGNSDSNTIAFSKGVGGAVEGQISETWIVNDQNAQLVSVAREPEMTFLPENGGIQKIFTGFNEPVLNAKKIAMVMNIANTVTKELNNAGKTEKDMAYDIELGIKDDKIWLFQVRPFVENKKANATEYLIKSSVSNNNLKLPLNEIIK
nr:PEP/pyruvate-binding domain-containing protein [uncultured Carboxylicivirga sp.]